jgi:solute carrier family 26 (sodium-independent sulfate anion transporter), member 11
MHYKPWNLTSLITKKLLHIDPKERYRCQPKGLAQRAKIAGIARVYCEHEPSASEFVGNLVPNKREAFQYARGLFPSVGWIRRYNARWLLGDTVAGKIAHSDSTYNPC